MTVAAGPFAIAATLLAAGGVLKALRPGDTAHALRTLGLPGSTVLVRLGGLFEAAVGVAALAVGDRTSAVLVAVSYLAFTAFVVLALARDAPISSCGCFGKVDTPPSRVHVGINLAAVAAAAAVAVSPGVGLGHVLAGQPLAGVPFVLLLGCGVGLAYLALTSLPRTMTLVRQGE